MFSLTKMNTISYLVKYLCSRIRSKKGPKETKQLNMEHKNASLKISNTHKMLWFLQLTYFCNQKHESLSNASCVKYKPLHV